MQQFENKLHRMTINLARKLSSNESCVLIVWRLICSSYSKQLFTDYIIDENGTTSEMSLDITCQRLTWQSATLHAPSSGDGNEENITASILGMCAFLIFFHIFYHLIN